LSFKFRHKSTKICPIDKDTSYIIYTYFIIVKLRWQNDSVVIVFFTFSGMNKTYILCRYPMKLPG